MQKIDKQTLIPVGLALGLAVFSFKIAADTSARFVSLEKDMIYYAKHVDHLIHEVRLMRDEVKKLGSKIEVLEEKID